MFMEWDITDNNYRNVFMWMIFNAFPANIMFKQTTNKRSA